MTGPLPDYGEQTKISKFVRQVKVEAPPPRRISESKQSELSFKR